ncbi:MULTISPECIES: hypothetical protein [unclassified Streptomyces]|uniref:hypothetical protein n=1 Tax=unclassified Streptomyces TaxID=2593676 RepID=UPI00382C643A
MSHRMADAEVRAILRPHRDGGPVSRLYAAGEITPETRTALGRLFVALRRAGDQRSANQVLDVLAWVYDIGERPSPPGWTRHL